ncbi:MAG: glycoside hydrolase family 43 protein, partial [Duncaniella sp.]|nr:glycoside hydrolase family 43 protein [Duncaniella sp.]
MKNYLIILCCLLGCVLTGKAQPEAKFNYFSYQGNDDYYNENPLSNTGDYYNPVISGWASDPSICRVGDDYWLVTSTFGYFPGVPLYHSRDLVSWEHVGNVLSRPSQLPWLEGLSVDKGGIYAPDITYNPHNRTYYMITTCVMNGGEGGSKNFYVTAKDPRGEWSDPVMLPDVEGIDPSFFFDEDGKAYIVHKSDEHSPVKWSNYRALSIIEFDPQTGKTVGEPVRFKEEGVGPEERLERNEGPHIYKINGKYYLLAAEGGTNWVHSEVCYRADSVFGPYRRWSRNPMLTQRLLKTNRNLPVT